MQQSAGNGDGAVGCRISRLRMASQRDAVSRTVDRILELIRDVGLNQERCHDLTVALSEALSNAAVHGNRLRAGCHVMIRVVAHPGQRAVVVIRDSGAGFDPHSLHDPTEPDTLLEPTGRGVFLMKKLVDRLDYNGRGNQVRLVVESQAEPG